MSASCQWAPHPSLGLTEAQMRNVRTMLCLHTPSHLHAHCTFTGVAQTAMCGEAQGPQVMDREFFKKGNKGGLRKCDVNEMD